MTPADLEEYLRKETELDVLVFANFDETHVNYLIIAPNGISHKQSVGISSFSLYSRLKDQLVERIVGAERYYNAARQVNAGNRTLSTLEAQDWPGIQQAKEAINRAKD